MADTRTLREKLEAMASQDVSPNEAAIAQAKLATMGAGDREPPRRPPTAPAPGDEWHVWRSGQFTTAFVRPVGNAHTWTFATAGTTC